MRHVLFALSLAVALASHSSFADPSLTVTRVQQRYPWNGCVDIDYAISGVTGDPNDYQVRFTFAANGATHEATNFLGRAGCDLPTANGAHRVTWDSAKDGWIALAANATVSAKLLYAPVTDADADYMIVDISAGSSASEYPVRYVRYDDSAAATAAFCQDTYRTERIVLKKIHAGTFVMGDGNTEVSTTKRIKVRLTHDYFMALFELTRGQYYRLNGTAVNTGYRATGYTDWPAATFCIGNISRDNYEINAVSRLNARTVCRGQSVANFNFPTEAQWEYACRAGTTNTYFWGSQSDVPLANYGWANTGKNGHFPVGILQPNPWGIYDLYGNVMEWTIGWYEAYPTYDPEVIYDDYAGAAEGSSSVLRGGDEHWGTGYCTSGKRDRRTSPGTQADFGSGYTFGCRLIRLVP